MFKMNLKPATILDNKESYNYNKADFSAMITFMRSINWKDGLCGQNMKRSWLMITNIVDQYKKQYVPKMRKRNLHGWITEHIKHKRENTKL